MSAHPRSNLEIIVAIVAALTLAYFVVSPVLFIYLFDIQGVKEPIFWLWPLLSVMTSEFGEPLIEYCRFLGTDIQSIREPLIPFGVSVLAYVAMGTLLVYAALLPFRRERRRAPERRQAR